MSRKQLTSKQHAFLEYLADHVRKTRVWPTYREIVDNFGYRSPNSVTQNLQALEKKGYLARDEHGYRLLGQRRGLPGGGFPVQGTVSDGELEIALSIEEVTLHDLFPGLSSTVAVRMRQPVRGIEVDSGDYLLVEEGDVPAGSMAAVIIDGEAGVCRLLQENGAVRLQYPDGQEVRARETERSLRVLGRYAGHINTRGVYRVPGLPAADGTAAGSVSAA